MPCRPKAGRAIFFHHNVILISPRCKVCFTFWFVLLCTTLKKVLRRKNFSSRRKNLSGRKNLSRTLAFTLSFTLFWTRRARPRLSSGRRRPASASLAYCIQHTIYIIQYIVYNIKYNVCVGALVRDGCIQYVVVCLIHRLDNLALHYCVRLVVASRWYGKEPYGVRGADRQQPSKRPA